MEQKTFTTCPSLQNSIKDKKDYALVKWFVVLKYLVTYVYVFFKMPTDLKALEQNSLDSNY